MSDEQVEAREGHRYFSPAIERLLMRTPIAKWNALAIVFDVEAHEARLMPRAALESWLQANDLPGLAREAGARKVLPGAILLLVLTREDGPKFRVLFDPRRKT